MFGQDLSDANLLRRVRRGDLRSFIALLKRHDPVLRGLAIRLLADSSQVDPALQRAYAKAWRAAGMARIGSGRDAVATWLYRVVYNACVDELRRQPRHPGPAAPTGPRVRLPRAPVERRLSGLRALPTVERIVLVLVDGEGFTVPAAAHVLQRQPADMAATLDRARRRWRDLVIGPPAPRAAGDGGESRHEGDDETPGAAERGPEVDGGAPGAAERGPEVDEEVGSTGEVPEAPDGGPVVPAAQVSPDITDPEEVVHAAEGAFDEERFATLKRWFRSRGAAAGRRGTGGDGDGDRAEAAALDDLPDAAPGGGDGPLAAAAAVEETGMVRVTRGPSDPDGEGSTGAASAGAGPAGTDEPPSPEEPAEGGHGAVPPSGPAGGPAEPGESEPDERDGVPEQAGTAEPDEPDEPDEPGRAEPEADEDGQDRSDESRVVKVGAEPDGDGGERGEESSSP